MWIHWPFFPKTWTKGHWPLDDLWPHVCWGHMCDSTQGSLCPSPMTIHQCMWIHWSIWQITTYIHILRTTYYVHTTYRMSDHIVSYWTQFRRDNYWTQFRRDKNYIKTQAGQHNLSLNLDNWFDRQTLCLDFKIFHLRFSVQFTACTSADNFNSVQVNFHNEPAHVLAEFWYNTPLDSWDQKQTDLNQSKYMKWQFFFFPPFHL